MSRKPQVAIITTGGTISQLIDEKTGALLATVSGGALVESIPELASLADCQLIDFSMIDSRDMTPELWVELANLLNATLAKSDIDAALVVHGTDTMEQTAYFLELTKAIDKPVAITGSIRSASEVDRDGPRNLVDAVRTLLSPGVPKQVFGVINGNILSAASMTKSHANNVNAFTGAQYGCIGVVNVGHVFWMHRPLPNPHFAVPALLARVDVVLTYPGDDGCLVHAAVAAGADGLVVVGYGLGNVTIPMHKALVRALAANVVVVLDTQVQNGRPYPIYGGLGGGAELKNLGVGFNRDTNPWKARILLMLALATGETTEAILSKYFDPWGEST